MLARPHLALDHLGYSHSPSGTSSPRQMLAGPDQWLPPDFLIALVSLIVHLAVSMTKLIDPPLCILGSPLFRPQCSVLVLLAFLVLHSYCCFKGCTKTTFNV